MIERDNYHRGFFFFLRRRPALLQGFGDIVLTMRGGMCINNLEMTHEGFARCCQPLNRQATRIFLLEL